MSSFVNREDHLESNFEDVENLEPMQHADEISSAVRPELDNLASFLQRMGENSELALRKDVNSVLETNALKRSTSFSRKGSATIHCVVKIFNGQSINFDFKKISKTLELFKSITEALKIWEIEYFGLYLTPLNQSEKNSYIWLDLNNPISTYVDSNQNQLKVTFSIKHFIANPAIISDDQVRYYFFTQTCIDIRQNKITVPPNVMPMLFALILQSQIGDFSPQSKFPDYSESLMPNIPEKMKIKIQQAHASLVGNSPSAAEIEFLNLAQHLPGYGQIKYQVLDGKKNLVDFTLSPNGISLQLKGVNINSIIWSHIKKTKLAHPIMKLTYLVNSQHTSQVKIESDRIESLYNHIKSYIEFFCSKNNPLTRVKSTSSFFKRSESFVIAKNKKNPPINDTSFDVTKSFMLPPQTSFLSSPMRSHVPLQRQRSSFFIPPQPKNGKRSPLKKIHTQKENKTLTVNIDAIAQALRAQKSISRASTSRQTKSLLRDDSFNAEKNKVQNHKTVSIKLERNSLSMSTESIRYDETHGDGA